jgi:uncharacterized C2H2 Zn-finger protein
LQEEKEFTRINIFHISTRKQDAELLSSKYTSFGAEVTVIEVADDIGTKLHIGKLYYFAEASADKIFANSLSVDLRDIELVSPHLVKLEDSHPIDFAVWIVRKPKNQANQIVANVTLPKEVENVVGEISDEKYVAQEIESGNAVNLETNALFYSFPTLVKCPKCSCLVRDDRLKKHITKAHEKKLNNQKKPKTNLTRLSTTSTIKRSRCRHCDSFAMAGDNLCFRCSR